MVTLVALYISSLLGELFTIVVTREIIENRTKIKVEMKGTIIFLFLDDMVHRRELTAMLLSVFKRVKDWLQLLPFCFHRVFFMKIMTIMILCCDPVCMEYCTREFEFLFFIYLILVQCSLSHRPLFILSTWFCVPYLNLLFTKSTGIPVRLMGSFHKRAAISSSILMVRMKVLRTFLRVSHSSRKGRMSLGPGSKYDARGFEC